MLINMVTLPNVILTFSSLVLSGGGVKCIYLLGFLYGLDLRTISTFIGVSSGAALCFLLALGYSPFYIFLKLLRNSDWLKHSHNNGLFDNNFISDFMSKLLIEKMHIKDITFDELYKRTNKRLVINAYNITKTRQEIFSYHSTPYMSCIKAIHLSSSIPFIFEASVWDNNIYIDGGLVNNFPLDIALRYDGHVLAITTLFSYYNWYMYHNERLNVVLINDKDDQLYLNATDEIKFDMFMYGYLYKRYFIKVKKKRRKTI
jgi:predicted acylesterase/phospholipase RssA